MPFVQVGPAAKLPTGSVMQAEVNGEPYAICNAAGELFALDGICPHSGGPLGEGALHEHWVVCPWHGWEFDCRTGANDFDPDLTVPTVPVKIENGQILIDVP